jgi:GT2 family glycosyltransferase
MANRKRKSEGSLRYPLSVAVSAWNCEKTIRRCLLSLAALEARQIIVCDLGSIDDTAGIVSTEFPSASLLQFDQIKSFARARNASLARLREPFVLFVDGDWVADAASVDHLIREAEDHKDCAIVVPRFMDDLGNKHIGHNVRRFPTQRALAAEFLMLHKVFGSDAVRKYRMLDFDHLGDRDVDHACGAFVLVRREALLAVGGYDESIQGAWMEDVDLAQRLHRSDWRCRFCASATALHLGRETMRHFFIERHYDAYYEGVLRYTARYLPNSHNFLRTCLLIGLVSKAAFSYCLPAGLRSWLLRHFGIYNSDEAIQGYRHMYLRAIKAACYGGTLC